MRFDERWGTSMPPVDRDQWLDNALRALPAPQAPRTLLPRVLAMAAEIQPRPWYARTWLTWPRAWQTASLVALALIIGTGVVLRPYAGGLVDLAIGSAAPVAARLGSSLQQLVVIPALVRVLWRAFLQPFALAGFTLAILSTLTCAAGLSAINRLAVSREGSVHP